MALSIDIAANTRVAQANVKDLGRALDDVSDALDDVARDASDSGGKAERALSEMGDAGTDAARDIESAGDRVERSFRDIVTDAKKADRAIGDVGDGGVRSLDRVKGGAQELQQEFGQNLGETVSSFRGDLSDLGQVGQDTIGGLAATVAGMGPLGLAGAFALAAGAAGLGAFTAGQEEAKAKQEELNAAAADWAQRYIDSAGRIVDAAAVVNEINAISTDPEKYEAAGKAAEDWGVDVTVAMRAMAGDATALEVVTRSLNDRTAESTRLSAEQEQQTTDQAGAVIDLADSVGRGRDRLDELNGVMTEGRKRAENAASALGDYARSAGVATGETDDLGNAIVELPGGKRVVIDAETGQAHEDLDAVERRHLNEKNVKVTADTAEAQRAIDNLKASIRTGATLGISLGAVRSGRPFEG